MDNSIDFFGFLGLAIYLSSTAFIAGIIFQTFIVVKYNKPYTWGKLTLLLIATRAVSLALTILIWKYWFLPFEMMQGPVLIPSIIAELIACPVMLYVFKVSVFNRSISLGKMTTGIIIETEFFPLAFFLFFCTPVIEINGQKNRRTWGTHFFELPPGFYKIKIYFSYLFIPECGANQIKFNISERQIRKVSFNMPPWIFAKGTMKEVPK